MCCFSFHNSQIVAEIAKVANKTLTKYEKGTTIGTSKSTTDYKCKFEFGVLVLSYL